MKISPRTFQTFVSREEFAISWTSEGVDETVVNIELEDIKSIEQKLELEGHKFIRLIPKPKLGNNLRTNVPDGKQNI